MFGALLHDLRYAVRMLAKSPGFTVVAVSALALGIGANTSIFTVANALLLRPLPYANPERLVLLSTVDPSQNVTAGPFSYPRFEFLQEHSRSFSGLAAFTNDSFDLTGPGDPEQLPSARVSASFFDVLRARPFLGRNFLPDEDKPGAKDVVLISHSLWTRRFGASPAILGQTITLNSQTFVVIGVTPPGFQFALLGATVDIWAPRVFDLNLATPDQIRAGAMYLNAVGRLHAGASLDSAQAEMDVLRQQYVREFPKLADANPKLMVAVGNLRDQLVANVRPAILILFGAVGLVLLIACANVASLLLSRALGRKKEIAVRTALGASRAALLRQLLIESVLLALFGGALGVILSVWGTDALARLAQGNLPRVDEIRTDGAVLAFTLAISLLTGVLFGLMPALQISRADLNTGLREEARGTAGGRTRNRFRSALVIGQVALSMVLLIAAGLLIRSFGRLLNTSPGFEPAGVLTLNIALPRAKYMANARMVEFYRELVARMERTPGVQSAAIASALPVNPTRFSPVLPEGQPQVPIPQRPVLVIQMVGGRYFETMRTPLLRGRTFNAHDDSTSPPAAIVNQALARRYWPNDNPLGKRILLGRVPNPVEVVGVAADIKNVALAADPLPEIYIPYPQRPWRTMNLILRTTGDPRALAAAARTQVSAIDPDQPVTAVQTLDEILAASRTQPRFIMYLLGIFSATAFVLAVVGLYGTISYSVAQRTQELGIRIALGATSSDIVSVVVRQGMALALGGVCIGFAISLALTRIMHSLLYNLSATDPATFIVSAAAFAVVALLASYIPARRAMRVDPTVALRRG